VFGEALLTQRITVMPHGSGIGRGIRCWHS
jgi:hypothetical protein